MASQLVEGPEGGKFVTAGRAASWLGMGKTTFYELVKQPWVACWMRPKVIPGKHDRRWSWLDVVALANILDRLGEAEEQAPAEPRPPAEPPAPQPPPAAVRGAKK